MEKITFMPGYQTIDATAFINRTCMKNSEFRSFLEIMSNYELNCFKELINRLYTQTLLRFEDIAFFEKDWYGRKSIRVAIKYPMGELVWSVLGNYEIYMVFQLYTFGFIKFDFTFEDLLREAYKHI